MPNDAPEDYDRKRLLVDLLKSVSRSFYLSMRVLPVGVRTPVSVAYLLARAADTIADTEALPPGQRTELLQAFRRQINAKVDLQEVRRISAIVISRQTKPEERSLLQSMFPAIGLLRILDEPDRADVRDVVNTLISGMEMDLATFPLEKSGKLVALKAREDLERYTFLVAGCVGPFWTRVTMRHVPALLVWDEEAMYVRGVRFGKALQYTNVLRDCPRDLRMGRCYLPLEVVAAHGLEPADLLKPENSERARPVLCELLLNTLDHYEEARRYVLSVPRRCTRIRLACLWPVLIGLGTLEKLASNKAWLDPEKVTRVSRASVESTLLFSWPIARSDKMINDWMERRLAAVRAAMKKG